MSVIRFVPYPNDAYRWYRDNILHREDGPAVKTESGTLVWMYNGQYHREDGPAIEYSSGTKVWYRNGQYHRDNGPAMIHADGSKMWYLYGEQYMFTDWCRKLNFNDEQIGAFILEYHL